jgi:hypothetical protein
MDPETHGPFPALAFPFSVLQPVAVLVFPFSSRSHLGAFMEAFSMLSLKEVFTLK